MYRMAGNMPIAGSGLGHANASAKFTQHTANQFGDQSLHSMKKSRNVTQSTAGQKSNAPKLE